VNKKKPEALKKGEMIRVRVTAEQKDLLTQAAQQAGLELSGWLRSIGLREAKRVLGPEQKLQS